MKNRKIKGLIVQPDDFEIGEFYALYGTKDECEMPIPIAGMAFKLTAMNLPFIVGKLACNPASPPMTIDSRFFSFMKVSNEFVQAQKLEGA